MNVATHVCVAFVGNCGSIELIETKLERLTPRKSVEGSWQMLRVSTEGRASRSALFFWKSPGPGAGRGVLCGSSAAGKRGVA